MNDSFTGKVISDKYRVDSYLAASRSGELYLGRHLLIGNTVTIKILAPEGGASDKAADGFTSEARSVSKIAHPNILNITDFGTDEEGTIFSVLEDASGENLAKRISDESPLAVAPCVRIARQIAAALSAAHSRGIYHGSLTARKVLFSKLGGAAEIVKVYDIGAFDSLPRNSDSVEDLDELAYRAPELFAAGAKPDERSDVYSLGILLYEMVAGDRPFSGETENEISQRHNQVPPPPLVAFRSDLPEGLETAILGALAKDPAKRYGSVEEFIGALNEAVEGEGLDEGMVAPMVTDLGGRNNTWKTAFIVLAGVSVLAFGLIYLTNSPRTDPATILQTDANSLPVQPINPATGMSEQTGLRAAPQVLAGDPDVLPDDLGGDGFDPWANTPAPPAGSSTPIGPPGDYVTVPGSGSVFMPADSGVELVPKIVTPTPTPKPSPAASRPGNTNTQQPGNTPVKETKPTPAPPASGATPESSGRKQTSKPVDSDSGS